MLIGNEDIGNTHICQSVCDQVTYSQARIPGAAINDKIDPWGPHNER